MRVNLESNFILLGSEDIDCIDFSSSEITLKGLLETISKLSTNSIKFLYPSGIELIPDWDIEINGQPLALSNGGISTVLKDGDRVSIKLMLLGGG